jgi:RNA polymerase sigma factor (sigma-70 family)
VAKSTYIQARNPWQDERPVTVHHKSIEEFLRGDPARVREIRDAVRLVVRGFQFAGGAIDEDLVQEVLGRICRNLAAGSFRGDSTLRTYAQNVARFTCLEHVRQRRLEARLDPEAIPSGARWSEPEGTLLRTEVHLRNLEIFAALPGESRELLRLVFIEGLSYAEVARRLGVTEGAIKSRVHKIRSACREAAGIEKALAPRRAGRRIGV